MLEALTDRTLRLHEGTAVLWRGAYGEAHLAWEADVRAADQERQRAKEKASRLRRRLADARRARARPRTWLEPATDG